MSYWILPVSGVPISRCTVQPMTDDEKSTDSYKAETAAFDEQISKKIGDKAVKAKDAKGNNIFNPDDNILAFMQDEDDKYEPFEPEAAMTEADDIKFTIDAFDKYIAAEVGTVRHCLKKAR
jgi:hypothetical protein